MKNLIAATSVAFVVSSAANAMDLGGGFSAGTELEANYNVDTEVEQILATPYVGWNAWGTQLLVETELDLQKLDDEELDLEWSATYTLPAGASVFAEVDTDNDFEFNDLTIGAKWKF